MMTKEQNSYIVKNFIVLKYFRNGGFVCFFDGVFCDENTHHAFKLLLHFP